MTYFHDTAVYTDPTIPPDRITFFYGIAGLQDLGKMRTIMLTYPVSDEERAAKEMADRLLNRSTELTLDMVQQAFDTAAQGVPHIKAIIMHPDLRRQYLALISADSRYGSDR